MSQQFEEAQQPAPRSLPEHYGKVEEEAVSTLANEVVESIRLMNKTVGLLERTAEVSNSPLAGEFVESLMRPAIECSEIAKGIVRALDAMIPLTSGESWQAWAEQTAAEPSEPAAE